MGSRESWLYAIGLVLIGAVILLVTVMSKGSERESVMVKTFESIASAGTWHSRVKLAVNLPDKMQGKQRPLGELNIYVEGDVRRAEENVLEMGSDFKVEARGKGNVFFAEGAADILPDAVAFRLSEFPALLNPSGSLSEKWTYVDTALLKVRDQRAVRESLVLLGRSFERKGREPVEGVQALHLVADVSDELEGRLEAAWSSETSGSAALGLLSRLMSGSNIKTLEAWVNEETGELVLLKAVLAQRTEGGEREFATLEVTATDLGKEVEVPRPKGELTVRPEVFAKLFGSGEISKIRE